MLKHNFFIGFVVGLISLMFLLIGCDKQAETPPKPKVITKKIVAGKDASLPPKPEVAETKQPVVKKPMPKPEVKTVATAVPEPKVATVTQPVAQPKVEAAPQPQPMPKAETIAKPEPKPEVAEPPKPEPVAETKDLTAIAPTEPGAADKKLVAVLSPTAAKLLKRDDDIYIAEGKLDPFAPLFEEKQPEPTVVVQPRKKAEKRIPLTPLEKVDLSQLKLVAIIQALSGDKALVTEASGKGYVVKKGTPIGNRSGKIVEILADSIVVEEEIEDIYGKVTFKKRSLQIQKPLGE